MLKISARHREFQRHIVTTLAGLMVIPVAGCVDRGQWTSSPSLSAIKVTSSHTKVPLGTAAQLKAIGIYPDGGTRDLTNTVHWMSYPAQVLSIDDSGLATARVTGAARIVAVSGSTRGSTRVEVSGAALISIEVSSEKAEIPLGTAARVTATGHFTDGSTRAITSDVKWESSPFGRLAIDDSGLAAGTSTGLATIRASWGSVRGAAMVEVSAAKLKSIQVTSDHPEIPVGRTAQLEAKGIFTDGSTRNITDIVTWTTVPTGIAGISGSGKATGRSTGLAKTIATRDGISGSAELRVTAPVISALEVIAPAKKMPLGTDQQLSAIGRFTDGSNRDLTNDCTWTSHATAVVSVERAGMARARRMGEAAVSATYSGVSAEAVLSVIRAAPVSISVAPLNSTIPVAGSEQLVATESFTDGSTQVVTQSATWNSDKSAIAAINSSGVALGLQGGETGVEASLGSLVGSATLIVQPVAAVGYFSHSQSDADTTVRLTNTGTTGPELCGMVYVFDQDQQMAECCGCALSTSGLRTLSLSTDLLSNPLTGASPVAGSIMVVPSSYSSGRACNPASLSPGGFIVSWATHTEILSTGAVAPNEEPLSVTPLSGTLSSALQAQCSFIQQLGSGQGICSCGTGD
jgi:hypothetical protein